MSTVQECVVKGLLVRISGRLRAHQQPMRVLLSTERAVTWMKSELHNLDSDGYVPGALRPRDQAAILFNQFVAGDDLPDPQPHEMKPLGNGIWEIRTADLRFFGWFPQRGIFVISAIAAATSCKDRKLYEGYYDQARSDRSAIDLMGGSYIAGGTNDVL